MIGHNRKLKKKLSGTEVVVINYIQVESSYANIG